MKKTFGFGKVNPKVVAEAGKVALSRIFNAVNGLTVKVLAKVGLETYASPVTAILLVVVGAQVVQMSPFGRAAAEFAAAVIAKAVTAGIVVALAILAAKFVKSCLKEAETQVSAEEAE